MRKITVVSSCYNTEDNVETCDETAGATLARGLPGYDVVAGARAHREKRFFLRSARNAFYRIVNWPSGFELSPDVGEIRPDDRKVPDAVPSHGDQCPHIHGIIASVAFERIIIPCTRKARSREVSEHNLMMLIDQALNAIHAFTKAPMRFCTFVGADVAALSFLFSLVTIALWFLGIGDAPQETPTIIVTLFFLSAVQFLFIEMLGEYITAINKQVRGGPTMIERVPINISAPDQKTGRVMPLANRKA